jgi:serine/threonine-protein kinase
VATPRIADQIGRVLGGRYRLVAPIGTGASAHVYVADDVELRRRVAVKVLHPALAEDESFLRRFRAEAQAVAGLRHPHVMQVFDWGQDLDGPFLVLEHLSGGSLRDLLDRGHRLSVSQALNVGLEAARGLDYAHRRGLVHRDIKPANLLFDDEGRLSIADFGLARALAEAAWTEPAGAVLGTARYASPEQARGSSVDGKADVYALTLTLIESVTGRVPFAADTTIATLMARIDRPIEVPADLGPLAPVLTAAGATDPAERLDAGELARRLEAAAADLPRPKPLPLAEPVPPTAVDLRRPLDDDLTFIGDAPTVPGVGVGGSGGGGGRRVFDVESVGPPAATGTTGIASADGGGRVRRRWWPKVLVALVLLAALAGGGVALAAAMKPTFPVPDLTGRTVADARRLVAGEEDFRVVPIAEERYDEQAPVGTIVGQEPAPAAGERKQGSVIRVHVSDGPKPRRVPDLTGMNRAQVQAALDGLGLVLAGKDAYDEAVAKDGVVDWSPRDGTLERGGTVTVTFSKGPEPKALPSFLDKVYDEYQKLLEGLGITSKKEEAYSDDVDKGKVIATEPAGPVAPGTEVTVIVSKGPEQVAVPNLSGLSEDEAASKLEAVGLRLGDRYGPAKRKVFTSRPAAGTSVDKGSSVDVYTG